MAEDDSGLRRILRHPRVYEALQSLMGAEGNIRRFVAEDLRPESGMRVLDIGCGTARLASFLGDVSYTGWEPNPAYVEQGRAENAGRDVTLHAGVFDDAAADGLVPVDLAVVSAVLHHLGDGEARTLFRLLARVLRPGGRVVTYDNVFLPRQNPVARWLISRDRGRNVRTPEGYAALASDDFAEVEGRVVHHRRIPYDYWIMTCRAPRRT